MESLSDCQEDKKAVLDKKKNTMRYQPSFKSQKADKNNNRLLSED